MTEFFAYDELTWPEVSILPRGIPLILPLGKPEDLPILAMALGNPSRAGLLPPFPFGWQGSAIEVPPSLLSAYVSNIFSGLHEDGFSNLAICLPDYITISIPAYITRLPITAPGSAPFPPDSEHGKVILLPIGHTEQHGHHLPLSTDTIIIEAISQCTAAAIPYEAYTLPVMPYGVSMHRSSFAGTLSAGGRAFEDFWMAVVDTLVTRSPNPGFDRFYFLNGHGGNTSFLTNIVKYAGDQHKRIFCATAFLYLSGTKGIATLEKYRRSPLGGMGHACELETSLVLHLRPELVHMERVVDETDFVCSPSYYMDWIEGGALVANPPWEDDTTTGAYGAGSLATAEHGKLWLDAAVAEKIEHVGEIHEQYRRREARRHLR